MIHWNKRDASINEIKSHFELCVYMVPEVGCWLWMFTLKTHGYGQFRMRGIKMSAHRAAWLLYCGSIPDGAHELHRCDVSCCVNPAHLFLGEPRCAQAGAR